MKTERSWRLFLLLDDWTWWVWGGTALLLVLGLLGYPGAFMAAIGLSFIQSGMMWLRERSLLAFPVQLRLAYTMLLIVCYPPPMRWLYWLPTLGTFALVIFGYCLLARMLSLLPWNRHEPITPDLLRRTFLSPPVLPGESNSVAGSGCAGGLCTIAAQVAPPGTAFSPVRREAGG